VSAAQLLDDYRRKQNHSMGLSFRESWHCMEYIQIEILES
jgi:hypothetical protein